MLAKKSRGKHAGMAIKGLALWPEDAITGTMGPGAGLRPLSGGNRKSGQLREPQSFESCSFWTTLEHPN